MIREKSLFCKLFRIKNNLKYLFNLYMDGFSPGREVCPLCGAKGQCKIHAYYDRNLVGFAGGRPMWEKILILRVICESCGHTHAILPDIIIPYDSYSLFFILRVLGERFVLKTTVDRLCERFCITRNQFYKWLKLWREHKKLWLGVLNSLETTSRSFLKALTTMESLSEFTAAFISTYAHSFLQSHRNPADYCQKAFSP